MAISLSKASQEMLKLLKGKTAPGETKKTYWDLMSDQLDEEGSWDKDLIESAKGEIKIWLEELKDKDVKNMWENSETAAEDYTEEETPDLDIMKNDLSEELLEMVLAEMEGTYGEEEYYIPEASSYDDANEDIDDDDFDGNDFFDDEDLKDDFDDDDFLDDEDDDERY